MTPILFCMLLNMVKIRDDKFAHILTDHIFQQFINTNMIVDELWMLRKEYPERLQEWKMKHRQIFMFRSKLLKFLEKSFGRGWSQNLIERAEMQRVRIWPLSVGGNKY